MNQIRIRFAKVFFFSFFLLILHASLCKEQKKKLELLARSQALFYFFSRRTPGDLNPIFATEVSLDRFFLSPRNPSFPKRCSPGSISLLCKYRLVCLALLPPLFPVARLSVAIPLSRLWDLLSFLRTPAHKLLAGAWQIWKCAGIWTPRHETAAAHLLDDLSLFSFLFFPPGNPLLSAVALGCQVKVCYLSALRVRVISRSRVFTWLLENDCVRVCVSLVCPKTVGCLCRAVQDCLLLLLPTYYKRPIILF